MTKKPKKKSAQEHAATRLVGRIAAMEAEEFFGRLRESAVWNSAEQRRAEKFQEIMQSLSAILGPGVDLKQEAIDAIEMWEETAKTEDASPDLWTPFELLLGGYHKICEEVLRIQDDLGGLR
jgi:hypothetical protein